MTGPASFTLEGIASKKVEAFGLYVVHPIVSSGENILLAETYGFKGDSDFGMVGGGLIVRRRLGPGRMLEAHGMIDGLQNREGFSYAQAGLGLAYTQGPITLRVNGYLPFTEGDERPSGRRQWSRELKNRAETVHWTQEYVTDRLPESGVDAEVEYKLPSPSKWFDPRIAVGYYYRADRDEAEVHSGLMSRLELNLGVHWSAEAEWRDDAAGIEQEWRVALRFQTLFGPAPSIGGTVPDSQEANALYGPVQRRPWPTVSESRHAKSPVKTETIKHEAAPVDCCLGGEEPLIFN